VQEAAQAALVVLYHWYQGQDLWVEGLRSPAVMANLAAVATSASALAQAGQRA